MKDAEVTSFGVGNSSKGVGTPNRSSPTMLNGIYEANLLSVERAWG